MVGPKGWQGEPGKQGMPGNVGAPGLRGPDGKWYRVLNTLNILVINNKVNTYIRYY